MERDHLRQDVEELTKQNRILKLREEADGRKTSSPTPQPFAIEVKDGKLCIQLEIAGVQAQK